MMLTNPFGRPTSIARFLIRAIVALVVLTAAWSQVARFSSAPAAWGAQFVLEQWSRGWVRAVHRENSALEVETRVPVPQANSSGMVAELVTDANATRYAYGLPLYLALLLAAGGGRWLRNATLGYAILLLPQIFSTVMVVLRNIVAVGGSARVLVVDSWQIEAIALGYQLGSLLLPTIVPIAIWLMLDRGFLVAMMPRVRKPPL